MEGKIVNANLVSSSTGYEIGLETNLFRNGKRVYIDMVHTSGLVEELKIGMTVKRGQPLLVLDKHWGPGGLNDLYLDIAIRNGPIGANPLSRNFSPLSYFSFVDMIRDDISALPPGDVRFIPVLPNYREGDCRGDEVPSNMLPRLTPTP